ncbi:tannase/feruloyl esterase family alpha/beta hydrolase [Massilia niastensis]|uniref:tannase/feruloyl esterase family alpha/beta hydrolase n=1 Tax=Massilia niastensis TaxID=544911 RepID=UPI00039A0ACB|nr:tannase/feruloyl esterase family alpha/beta hydrolase [Massilia niastensis]
MKRHNKNGLACARAARAKLIQACVLIPIALALAGCGGNEDEEVPVIAPASPVQTFSALCAGLVGKTIGTGKLTAASVAAATATAPESCSASGEIVSSAASTTRFTLTLPNPQSWNKKLIHLGGGAYNGTIPAADPEVTKRGYAIVASDSGHQGNPLSFDFALNNPAGFDNFAFASVPKVYDAALAGVRLAYDASPERKYFFGASTGGREALQQAMRNPSNYDGIIALEPVVDYSAVNQKGIEVQKRIAAGGGAGWLSPAKVSLVESARLAACDSGDGLADGIISDAEHCAFNPVALRCASGTDSGAACLSDAQLATVQVMTSNGRLAVPTANGVTTAFQFGVGAEADPSGWTTWNFGTAPSPITGMLGVFATGWARFAVLNDANADILTHDPAAFAPQWLASSIKSNANNPDMHLFAARGGKLLLWHGWSDHLVQPRGSIDLYNRTVQAMGDESVNLFMRFYMSPGVTHSFTGPGASSTDFLTVLEAWVERGTTPPEALVSTKRAADGSTVLTRPTCRYPAWPRYNGSGDKNLAASFTCIRT